MKKLPLVFILLFVNFINAQNLDSLFSEFMRIKSHSADNKIKHLTSAHDSIKCSFGIVNDVKTNFNYFSNEQQSLLKQYLSRPATDTSIVSLSGRFRIHFKKSGAEIPGYSVTELAKAADSTYNYEINNLKYLPPPNDGTMGGDNKYDIYLVNLTSGLYGYTEFETQLTADTYTSFIVMDNDFSSHYTQGIDGAKVTIAHEFHHMIQLGSYIYRTSDQFYHELTSTAMEEFVYDSINDYYAYIRSYTDKTHRTFSSNNGYNLAIWNIFLKERFGADIIKRSWELMKQKRALNAIADAIAEYGSTFKTEFSLFGQWLYFTGSRAKANKYFEEGKNYPLVKPLMVNNFVKPQTSVTINSEPASLNFLLFNNNVSSRVDSFVAIISNNDVTNAVSNVTNTLNFKYILSENQSDGFRKILDGYYSKVESENTFLLAESNIFNNNPTGDINTTEISYVFPQPFRYSKNIQIYFPVGKTLEQTGELYIYSTDMNLIYSGNHKILLTDKLAMIWNGLNSKGEKLATGVYFYVTKTSDKTNKGKFVIFND
ncbi:MAG: hypothetical protein FJ214_08770 [Ignavibacteria bacterium]|nr:hypothetical protein [Ignavibacteria bacterium]